MVVKEHPLREMIKEAGLKQNHLAKKFGISQPYFNLMLHGERTMPERIEKEIEKLCLKVLA